MALDVTYTPERFEGRYVRGIRNERQIGERIAGAVKGSAAYRRTSRRDVRNPDAFKSSLLSAWTTEHLLLLTGSMMPREGIGAATNWSVVQTYYACYQMTRALALARGGAVPLQSHAKVRRVWQWNWCRTGKVLLPWSFGFGASGVVNPPNALAVPSKIRVWDACTQSNCWTFIAQAFRTTRGEELAEQEDRERDRKSAERRRAWERDADERKARGRPLRRKPPARANLDRTERNRIDQALRAFTLIDFLYRLRIRSNYEDVTMWTEGPREHQQSVRVHRNLELILSSTLLLHELFIRRLVGTATFDAIANEWLSSDAAATPTRSGLRARSSLLLSPDRGTA